MAGQTKIASWRIDDCDGQGAVATQEACLRVVLQTAVMDWNTLAAILNEVSGILLPGIKRLLLDFTDVAELRGPWGSHFAVALKFYWDSGIRIKMVGLRGQPLALARSFSGCRLLSEVVDMA